MAKQSPKNKDGKDRKKYIKTEKITVEDRVRDVQQMLINGMFTKDIVAEGMKRWGVTDRTVYNYIETAYAEFKELRNKDIESSLARHIETRWHLYKELLKVSKVKKTGALHKDPKVVGELRMILMDIARLEGLYVEKVDHTTKGEKITGFNYTIPNAANDTTDTKTA